MLSFIKLPVTILGLLEANTSPREVAFGVCLGLFLGLIPLNGPMAMLLVLFFFVFKINRISTILVLPFIKGAYCAGLVNFTERLGAYLLMDTNSFSRLWGWILGLPVLALLDLNNTLVAGGLITAAALSAPLYFISKITIMAVRRKYSSALQNSKIAKALTSLKLINKVDTAIETDSRVSVTNVNLRQAIVRTVRARLFKKKTAAPAGLRKRVNIVGIACVMIVVCLAHFGVGYFMSPWLSSSIVDAINRSSGSKIQIERVNLWPFTLSVSLRGVKVFDPDIVGKRIILVKSASFGVSPLALLARRLVVARGRLDGVEVNLEGTPDGGFNIQHLSKPGPTAKKEEGVSLWELAQAHKDWAGRIYGLIRKGFSKKASEKIALESREAHKVAPAVEELPRGRRVHFKTGRDRYAFEAKDVAVTDALVTVVADNGETVEISNARMVLGGVAFDKDNGIAINTFVIRGDVRKGGASIGGIELDYHRRIRRDIQKVDLDIALKEIDLAAVRFIYEDSLPVAVEQGALDLRSATSIVNGAIDSKNSITLVRHRLSPKNASDMAFGIVPMTTLCDAMNGLEPLLLQFDIGGTVDDPEFRNFQDSLLALVRPHLDALKQKVIEKGADMLRGFLKKQDAGQEEQNVPSSDKSQPDQDVKATIDSISSLFGGKKSD